MIQLGEPRVPRRSSPPAFAVFLLAIVTTLMAWGQNWPGWRGDGSGASSATGLPTHFGPDQNVRWKTRIEGEGVSSPIVWENRVFVTTALEGTERQVAHTVGAVVAFGLLAVALGAAAMRCGAPSQAAPAASAPAWWHAALRLDKSAAVLTTCVFVVGMSAALLQPERFFARWIASHGWLTVRNVAMFGLMAAMLWIPARSWWRMIPALVLVAMMFVSYPLSPTNEFGDPLPRSSLLPMRVIVPGAALILWSWLLALLGRRHRDAAPRSSWFWRVLGPIVLLAGVAFLSTYALFTPVDLQAALIVVPTAAALGWLVVSGRGGAKGRPVWGAIAPGALAATALLLFWHVNVSQSNAGYWRAVVCVNRDSGQILWTRAAFRAPGGKKYPQNTYATPTPATDGTHLVADFAAGLACMDLDGTMKWHRLEPTYEGITRYGASSSPVLFENLVITTFIAESRRGIEDVEKNSYIRARELTTGEVVWQTTPPGAHDSYGTPLIAHGEDGPLLLFVTATHAVAYDPRTGELVWSCQVPTKQVVPSIVADTTTAYVIGGLHYRRAMAIPLTGPGDSENPQFRWDLSKPVPMTASPILHDGLLYWITRSGIAVCVDAIDGQIVWTKRLGGQYFPSPVLADGKIYFPSDTGEVIVAAAGREFKQLAKNTIGEEVLASPAVSNRCLFLRTREHLYCIEKE